MPIQKLCFGGHSGLEERLDDIRAFLIYLE
jgi:hypothetical protein